MQSFTLQCPYCTSQYPGDKENSTHGCDQEVEAWKGGDHRLPKVLKGPKGFLEKRAREQQEHALENGMSLEEQAAHQERFDAASKTTMPDAELEEVDEQEEEKEKDKEPAPVDPAARAKQILQVCKEILADDDDEEVASDGRPKMEAIQVRLREIDPKAKLPVTPDERATALAAIEAETQK
jgi:hypothetical protein